MCVCVCVLGTAGVGRKWGRWLVTGEAQNTCAEKQQKDLYHFTTEPPGMPICHTVQSIEDQGCCTGIVPGKVWHLKWNVMEKIIPMSLSVLDSQCGHWGLATPFSLLGEARPPWGKLSWIGKKKKKRNFCVFSHPLCGPRRLIQVLTKHLGAFKCSVDQFSPRARTHRPSAQTCSLLTRPHPWPTPL